MMFESYRSGAVRNKMEEGKTLSRWCIMDGKSFEMGNAKIVSLSHWETMILEDFDCSSASSYIGVERIIRKRRNRGINITGDEDTVEERYIE